MRLYKRKVRIQSICCWHQNLNSWTRSKYFEAPGDNSQQHGCQCRPPSPCQDSQGGGNANLKSGVPVIEAVDAEEGGVYWLECRFVVREFARGIKKLSFYSSVGASPKSKTYESSSFLTWAPTPGSFSHVRNSCLKLMLSNMLINKSIFTEP